MYLAAEEGLFKTVTIHNFNQVFQDLVEHLVELFPNDGQRLLGRQYGCVELHL